MLAHLCVIPGAANRQDLALAHRMLPVDLASHEQETLLLFDRQRAAIAEVSLVALAIPRIAENVQAACQRLPVLGALVIEIQLPDQERLRIGETLMLGEGVEVGGK